MGLKFKDSKDQCLANEEIKKNVIYICTRNEMLDKLSVAFLIRLSIFD